MKKVHLIFAAITLISFTVMMSSCQKDDTPTTQTTNTKASEDNTLAESIFDNVSVMADEAYYNETGGTRDGGIVFGGCVTVTLDTSVMPRVLTIDFGEENCLCLDGKYRRGMIIVTFNGRYKAPGTVITHTFDNYYVNDNKVDGTKVVTNMGPNEDGNIYYTIEVTGVIHLADGNVISWNSSRQREWLEGYETPTRWDDVYLLTGIAHGIRANDMTWDAEILTPLRKELVCRFIVSGTIEIRPENLPVRLLDYGDGECDNIATVTINGEVYTIYLR